MFFAPFFLNHEGYLYFAGEDTLHGVELWRTDGTVTERITDLNPTGDANPLHFISIGDWLYFFANDSELWRTRGKEVQFIEDVPKPATFLSSHAPFLAKLNQTLCYTGFTGRGSELYCLDTTLLPENVSIEKNNVMWQNTADINWYPNPVSQTGTLKLKFNSPDQVKIEVFNTLGRHQALIFEGPLGQNEWQTFNVDTGTWPSGIYIIRVSGASYQDNLTISVIH